MTRRSNAYPGVLFLAVADQAVPVGQAVQEDMPVAVAMYPGAHVMQDV